MILTGTTAAETYARRSHASLTVMQSAAEIQTRAQRLLGEMLIEMPKNRGENGQFINQNNNRRHQTASERAVAGTKLANITNGNIKAQHSASPIGEAKPLVSREEAAEKLGVSTSSMDRARRVLAEGSPQIVKALEQGHITVNRAYEETRAEAKHKPAEGGQTTAKPSMALSIAKQAMNIMRTIPEDDRLRKLAFLSLLFPR